MASGAFDLLQKLHRVIEELQEEIKNLQLQNQMLKTQNEELKMERDEVGTQNPKQLTHAHQSKVKCQNGQPSAIERQVCKNYGVYSLVKKKVMFYSLQNI